MSRQAEIRERLERGTPGPWQADDGDGSYWGVFQGDDSDAICYMVEWSGMAKRLRPGTDARNAALIAAAPADIRYLLDRLEKAEGLLNEAMSLTCPVCEACSRAANSDATTAGFMYCKCPTHRAIESFLKESA